MCDTVAINGEGLIDNQGDLSAHLGCAVGDLVMSYGTPKETDCLCPVDLPGTAAKYGFRIEAGFNVRHVDDWVLTKN